MVKGKRPQPPVVRVGGEVVKKSFKNKRRETPWEKRILSCEERVFQVALSSEEIPLLSRPTCPTSTHGLKLCMSFAGSSQTSEI